METERLWGVMWNSFHDFNRKGIFMAAMSGIDLAIWDAKGKLLNAPVREILGGKSDPIPCYATGNKIMLFQGVTLKAFISLLMTEQIIKNDYLDPCNH